jgi:WhiB family transcriptional regulator, redox-sensing transcriptional regulator
MSRSSRRHRRQRAARQMRRSRRFNTVRVAVAVPLLAAAPSLKGAGTLTATAVAVPPRRRPIRRRRENLQGFSLFKPPKTDLATSDEVAALSLESEQGGNWRKQAVCAEADPEAFFPEKGGSTHAAKKICQRCDVRDACLEFALKHDERFGIWGGLSERERRRLKLERSASDKSSRFLNA